MGKTSTAAGSNRRKFRDFQPEGAHPLWTPMHNSGARDIFPELFCPSSAHLTVGRPGCRGQNLRAKGALASRAYIVGILLLLKEQSAQKKCADVTIRT
jgi:hypothetical protein